jgi:hypothetical protein
MDPETHTIEEFDFCPGQYGFQLQDSVQPGTLTLTENITGGAEFDIVATAPNPGQVYINYNNGICVFNVADDGKSVVSNGYNGGGSNANIQNLGLLASFAGKTTDDLTEGVTNLYANATSIPAIIHAASAKNPPVDTDELPLADSAASFGLKKLTFANLFLWIIAKIYGLTAKTTPADADQFLITDSAASNVGKSLTWANIKTALASVFQTKFSAKSAWVNFNGTGTVAINASSSNVSSITDNGTGDYTVNFSPAFADANYAATVTVKGDGGAPEGCDITSQAAGAFRFILRAVDGTPIDCSIVNVIVFGN